MIKLLINGECFLPEGIVIRADVLVLDSTIEKIGKISTEWICKYPGEVEIIDCEGLGLAPALLDPHLHLAGGSGEGGGFHSQSPEVLISECVLGGITTVVGTLGVDTTTKAMPDLLAKVKSFNEIGLTAFCYVGGYDCPPKTITGSVRNDLIFISEIIGVGEIAISDHRAPEPTPAELARASIDAAVGGMLSGKAGITHFHVGTGDRKLQSVRELMNSQVIDPAKLFMTHMDRSEALVREGIELARKGCFMDFDICERNLARWYRLYLNEGGPKNQMTVSSDAGYSSAKEIWSEIRNCVLEHKIPFGDLLPHFTSNTANVLKLSRKGKLQEGFDADIIAFTRQDLELRHVLSKGKFFVKDGSTSFTKLTHLKRRGFDIYEIH